MNHAFYSTRENLMKSIMNWSIKLTLRATIGCMIVLAITSSLKAQDWPVNHAPLYGPVKQYVSPSYPLHDTPVQNEPAQIQNQPAHAPANTAPPKTPQPNNKVKTKSPKSLKAKPKTAKKDKKKEKLDPHYGVDYTIYRDTNQFPIDPRKPCNSCVRPYGNCPNCKCNLPGFKGQPYIEKEPGGCKCGKKHPAHHPDFSLHWPRPFSARLDDRHPDRLPARYSPCPKKRFVDIFDPLSTFKLSSFKRKDNGYYGVGSDPYGCVGESKHGHVAGSQ